MMAKNNRDKQEVIDIYQDLLESNIIVEAFQNKSDENINIQFRIDIADKNKVFELLERKYKDYMIIQRNIVKVCIVGYGIIQDNNILKQITQILRKNDIEIIDINLTQSKIEIIVKNIENSILQELHKQLIKQ